ncbi:JmjC domain-containing protein [Streptomyces sp. NPDC048111]|uniref:JmjC domain-containing protein n=1 Tax=Streptomyces sp. NPDC048111 TaxID=3365500 RepID=UPI00371EAE45
MRWGVLDRLLGEPERFLDACDRGRPLVLRPRTLPQEVPTLRELTCGLGGPLLRPPYVEMVRDGRSVAVSEYSAPVAPARAGEREGFADPERIMRLMAEGATLLLPRLDEWNASVGALSALLARDLGRETDALCCATTAATPGAGGYRDEADVLVVQLVGRKRWTVADAPAGRDGLPEPPPADGPALDTVLAPGDVLFVPRGAPHTATGGEGLSVHLALVLGKAGADGPHAPSPARPGTPDGDDPAGSLSDAQLLDAARELLGAARRRVDVAVRRGFAPEP